MVGERVYTHTIVSVMSLKVVIFYASKSQRHLMEMLNNEILII